MSWRDYGYEIVTTGDGSPSLRSLAISTQEMMHHSLGAYTETQWIYGKPIRDQFDQGRYKVCAVGLGLGYNEILVAVEALKRGINPEQIFLLSYEKEEILRRQFLSYLSLGRNSLENQSIAEDLQIYKNIVSFFIKETNLTEKDVQEFLLEMLDKNSWILKEAISAENTYSTRFNVIVYDLFSSKTDPEPWSEAFLFRLLENYCDSDCMVATYAQIGALKRSLLALGFQLLEHPGFHGKKGFTLARRSLDV